MENTSDINTGNEIRLTDNKPKEGDYYELKDQYNRPMSELEIKEKINEVLGD